MTKHNHRTKLEDLKFEKRIIEDQVKFAEKRLRTVAGYYSNELSRLNNIEEEIDTERFREQGLDRAGRKL